MEKLVESMPGYRVYEYQLVLRLPQPLWHKIQKVKEGFAKAYQADQALWGRPHITLIRFVQYEMMEARIVNRINCISMGQYPFKVTLSNYSSFPSHTIYIPVTAQQSLMDLVKQLRKETQRLMKWDEQHKPYFLSAPLITVATNLQINQYNEAWTACRTKHFSGQFIADSLLLLKKPVNEKHFQIVHRFTFQHLPVAIKQAELFV